MFFCKNQGGDGGDLLSLMENLPIAPPHKTETFVYSNFPLFLLRQHDQHTQKFYQKSFSNLFYGVGVQYAVSRIMGGYPRAKQYAVSRHKLENFAGPIIIFNPMTCRLENTSIRCYSTDSQNYWRNSTYCEVWWLLDRIFYIFLYRRLYMAQTIKASSAEMLKISNWKLPVYS